ncbi:hypothetical protein A3B45_04095 [Candidatus Daviesbacteria bacterium RIFCSPLOWO2_01_FULL_39_12]|uniref:Peptidase M41 domain-containing protein n=1 Tax=Candidatus Daviesbacteria bacterium RIFCSPLOWO2_01_FULL_39_12 TaxID=1797785 RepID=A0A1F5KSF4_9BACT|nr:MAG: hypothetical protein A3D79_01075 [Candidatus Daviesbacteria bacterium RIFCSPHIGHO2_02_FULL_39_8]OGE43759.1 MAG: hypothetical protein A3B45_04095 [Candidatus Daviesbacteria bacterium RIFCSPLOWO2_01_FULL_39_12]
MERLVEIKPGISEIYGGWKAKVKPIDCVEETMPSPTAEHEAAHTVAALLTGSCVRKASRIPGPGYSGITELNGFNGVAFMAAHALGCSGTGYDRLVVSQMGHDPDLLAGVARGVLSGHEEEISAVASLIEVKETISGTEALWVMNSARNPQAEVTIINPAGEKARHFVTKIRGSLVFLSIDL